MLQRICVAVALTTALAPPVGAYEKGDEVVVIVERTKPDPKDQRRVTFKYGEPLWIREVRGDRFEVVYYGRKTTVAAAEVIPKADAVGFFSKAVEHEESPASLVARGRSYDNQGREAEALRDFDRALELDSEFVLAYVERGNLYANRGDSFEAYADLERAGKLAPNDPEVLLTRARTRFMFGRTRAAGYEDFAAVLRLQPDNFVALNNRAKHLIDDGRHDEAFADLNRAIEIFPEYSEAYTNRGIVHHRRGEMDAAVREATDAIRHNERNISAWNNRGNAYIELKQFDEAVADFTKITEFKPDDTDGYYGRANTYYLAGNLDAALDDIERVIQISPLHYKARNTQGNVLKQQGEYTRAVGAFDTGVYLLLKEARDRGDPTIDAVESCLNGDLSDHETALQFGNRSVLATIIGNRADAYRNLIETQPDAADKMFADLDRAVAIHPENPMYQVARGEQRFNRGEFEAALIEFDAAFRANPNYFPAIRGRLMTNRELKSFAAVREITKYLKDNGVTIDAELLKQFEREAAEAEAEATKSRQSDG